MADLDFDERKSALTALGIDTETPSTSTVPDVVLPPAPTDPEIVETERAEDAKPTEGFFDLVGKAWSVDNSLGRFMDDFDSHPKYFYDPAFNSREYSALPDVKSRVDALVGADQDEVTSILGSSLNLDHYEDNLRRMEEDQANESALAEAGAAGFMAHALASILDPVDLAVSAVVAPLGAGVKLTRIGRGVKAALAAGASNATIEAYVASNNPYRDGTDVALAAISGIALGGPLGMLGRSDNARLHRVLDNMTKDQYDEAGEKLVNDSVGAQRRVLQDGEPIDGADLKASVDEIADDADVTDPGNFRWGWTQRLQRNYIGRLLHNTTDTTRTFASRIIEGGFLVDKKATRAFTAEGRMNNLFRTSTSRFYLDTKSDFTTWAARNGFSGVRRELGAEAGERFYSEVGQALRGVADNVSPEATAAAAKIRPLLNEFHEMAKEVGLPGFKDSDPLENFFPRTWAEGKLVKLFDDVDEANVALWFKEAILLKQEGLSEDILDRLSRGFTKAIRSRTNTLDDLMNHGIPLTDLDRARELFEGVMDPADVDALIDGLRAANAARAAKAGKIDHGKTRLRFDETYSGEVRTKSGEVRTLGIDDMTITDARKTIPRYFQTMSGAIGLAKEAGIRSEGDVKKLLAQIASEGGTRDEQQALLDVISLVRGHSVERNPYSGVAQAGRLAAAYDYTRFGGSFGLAQLPELGNIIGEAGILTFLRNIPEYSNFLSRAADGSLNHGAAREIEELLAPGTDWVRNPAVTSFDEYGLGFDTTTWAGKVGDKVDAPLQVAARATGALSLMAPINAMLERIASFEVANSWAKMAHGKKKVRVSRMRAAGLSEEAQERVFDSMRKHSVFEDGKLKSLNTEKWDATTRDDFVMALDRERSFTIQRNDIGNTGRYIHTTAGRMLTRFMTFMLNSANKQLLRGISHADVQTFMSFGTSMFIASMVYVAQTSVDYANDEKRRKERLTPGRIAAAAYQRAGFAAITVPIIDSARTLTGFDPLFKYGRTSGLGTDLITGNPTITGAQDIVNTATLPLRLALQNDYQMSQQDWQRIERLIPLQRVLGVKNALHAISEDLPRESTPR